MSVSIEGAIAVTRFGMGARKGEIKSVSSDPRGWLSDQLDRPGQAQIKDRQLPNTKQAVKETIDYFQRRRELQKQAKQSGNKEALQAHNRKQRDAFVAEVAARNLHTVRTQHGFLETLGAVLVEPFHCVRPQTGTLAHCGGLMSGMRSAPMHSGHLKTC